MHYVYFIQSLKRKYSYVGYTEDLKKRIERHNSGYVIATREYAPFNLVYFEAFLDERDAIEREKKLKHHGSVMGHLKKRLANSIEKAVSPKGRG